jgi:hypothetical protein
MRTLSFKKLALVGMVAILVGLVSVTAVPGVALADESLDQLLSTALENHPDIVAAKAKVALAEAELNAARLQVARELIGLWGDKNSQEAAVAQIEEQMKVEPNKRDALAKSLQDARVKSEMTQMILKYLTERTAPASAQVGATPGETHGAAQPAEARDVQIPPKAVMERLAKQLLPQKITLAYDNTPLGDVIEQLSAETNYPFFIDIKSLSESGNDPREMPVTMVIKESPLPAVLQAFQDQHLDLVFVLRDYGILLTTVEQAKEQGYPAVLDLAKDLRNEKDE